MKSIPLPRWLVLGNSAIIVGMSAVLAGWSLGVIMKGRGLDIFLGWVLLAWSLAVAVSQYSTGFRRNLNAAEAVSVMHCLGCLFTGFYSMSLVSHYLTREKSTFSDEGFDAIYATGLWIYSCFCVWMNDYERRCLEEAKEAKESTGESVDAKPFQFTLRELLGVMLIVSIIASFAKYMYMK